MCLSSQPLNNAKIPDRPFMLAEFTDWGDCAHWYSLAGLEKLRSHVRVKLAGNSDRSIHPRTFSSQYRLVRPSLFPVRPGFGGDHLP